MLCREMLFVLSSVLNTLIRRVAERRIVNVTNLVVSKETAELERLV
jgi:hypothetical protein